MKRIVFLLVLCFVCRGWSTEEGKNYHTFTDTKGRSIKGEIVWVNAHKKVVTIKRDNGVKADIPIGALSDADQKYIYEWNMMKDFLDEKIFKITVSRFSEDNKEKSSSSSYQKKDVENMGYDIAFENRSAVAFYGIDVEYCIFYEQETSSDDTCEQGVCCGKKTINMDAKQEKSFKTDTVLIYKYELSSDYIVTNGSNTQEGEIHGIWLRLSKSLKSGEVITRDYCLPDSTSKRYKWTTESVKVGLN